MELKVLKADLRQLFETTDIHVKKENNKIFIKGLNNTLDVELHNEDDDSIVKKLITPGVDSEKMLKLMELFVHAFDE